MDNTDIYVKMVWESKINCDFKFLKHMDKNNFWSSYKGIKIILPRQDQLQNFFISNHRGLKSDQLIYFLDFIHDRMSKRSVLVSLFKKNENRNRYSRNKVLEFTSMEQITLAFIMLELYNKKWRFNKKKWIK